MTHSPRATLPPSFAAPSPRPPARGQRGLIVPPPGAIRPGSEVPDQELAEDQARIDLIRRLGIPTDAHDLYDEFATQVATSTGFLYGMVNLFLGEQTFIGLHNPPEDSGHLIVGRTLHRRHGWCPEVVERKKALPLPNVHASPRFSGNHVVDSMGIQSYFGTPLLHEETGIVLVTVCVIDVEPRPLSDARRLRDIVKDTGATVMKAITAAAPKP